MRIDIFTHGGVTRNLLFVSVEVDDFKSGKEALDEKEIKILIQQLKDGAELLEQFLKDFKDIR